MLELLEPAELAGWAAAAAGVVFCLMLVPYVLGPIMVFSMLRFTLPAEVIQIDPVKEPLPDEVRRYFAGVYDALTACGFQLVATIVLPPLIPNVRSILALYANRTTGDQAMSTLIIATGGIETLKTRYVEFLTRYSDGLIVQTNNSPELGAFRPLPQERTAQFWEIDDVPHLHRLHQFHCGQHRRAGQPVCSLDSRFGGNAVAYVQQVVLKETLEAQVAPGYLTLMPWGLRASYRGACVMAWQELWPIKGLRKQRRAAEAQAILAEFEATQHGRRARA